MKTLIGFLKFLMYFVTAIWGMVLGLLFPVSLLLTRVDYNLTDKDKHSELQGIAALWLITVIVGYITPCFLVKFKKYKIAAVLTVAGAVSVLVIYNSFAKLGGAFMPLLAETVAVVLIAVLDGKVQKARQDNAPSPSILGKNRSSQKDFTKRPDKKKK